jgi:signal peptidase I
MEPNEISVPVGEPAASGRKKNKKEKKENPFEPKGVAGSVYVMLHDMVCILAVIVVSFIFLARLVGVSGSSMYPTLVGAPRESDDGKGDYLILRSNFLCSTYEQGDIVVACVPTFDDGKPIVKRVIAVGGQTVSFRMGDDGHLHVYVDDVLQSEEHINEPMNANWYAGDGYTATVPEGCYFLMGDNRNNSTDSRYPSVGMVDGRYIVGKALLLVFPGQDLWKENARDWSRLGDIYD